MNKVSIIIVTYNGIPWLRTCLDSCKEYTTIVVDNNSTDGTVEVIKEEYPSVVLLVQTENLGFGGANNLGIKYALNQKSEYVFLLNQDAYLELTTIDKLIEVYLKNKEFGILSPIHLNGNSSKLDFNFSNYLVRNKEFLYDAVQHQYTKNVYEVPFVNAAAWLLPKKTLEIIGGFDPLFYHYAEDDNYCNRVLYHNLKIGIVPNCYVQHDREYRKDIKIVSNQEKLILKERSYKDKLSNINNEINGGRQKLKIKKAILKFVLQLKLKNAIFSLKELNLLIKILPEIKKSRKINSKTGKHYLDL